MLVLALLLTVAVLANQSQGINLTYIVKKEGDKLQPNCLAEENERYAGIGWVFPLPEDAGKMPETTTKFLPNIENPYNCKFSKNDKCNKFWALKNWEIDENSTRTLHPIFDSRWEDFPTIATGFGNEKEFQDMVEVPGVFQVGLSLRASGSVELLLCDGWNPYTYPCYHFSVSVGDVFLRKFAVLPKNNTSDGSILDSYKAFTNILSGDEWRNFIINLDKNGTLSMTDVGVNRTIIQYQDKKPITPLYLLMKSNQPALWKIHQNHFMYTKTPGSYRLGPILNLPSKTLCVSLYISACQNCKMIFFIMNEDKSSDPRRILMEVGPPQGNEWRLIKLKHDQIFKDKLSVFIETKFVDGFNAENGTDEGFWAIDDVRVCHENEVKVTFLKLKEAEENLVDDVSCQIVRHPKWRPKKLVYPKIKAFPTIDSSSNSSSISLNWTQEDPNNQINYFITYQANDLCLSEPFNLRRIKSNGFLMTRHNEISITNLVPYTKYNITFSSMLHEQEKKLYMTTLETAEPTPEELPTSLQLHTTDTQLHASWPKIDCVSIYGHVMYSIQLINTETNMMQEVSVPTTDNNVMLSGLTPYTLYTFKITTARSYGNIENNTRIIAMERNFTTQPGTAPPVEGLELYSVGKNSVSFRFDLPKKARGVPKEVQVTRCNVLSFSKCKAITQPLTKCALWHRKYCAELSNLIPNQSYSFRISVKNDNAQYFGDEVKIDSITISPKAPAPPTNISYRIVDCKDALEYCHLNITWLHPYNQNGTISAFHIVLNSTDNTSSESIQEVLTVPNKTYTSKYDYQIKYIPYSTHYELYVQSVNSKYKSQFASVHVKTDDIGDHIDQNPTLLETKETSVVFKRPHLDPRLESYTLTILVQDFDAKAVVPRDLLRSKKISDHLCHDFGNAWVLPTLLITNKSQIANITVGDGNSTNKLLAPSTQYCVTFIVTNRYKNREHDVIYYKNLKTLGDPTSAGAPTSASSQYKHLWGLLVLLLIVPAGYFAYRWYKKRRPKPKRQENNKENVYESLPFEECEESNCVNNDTYDHLLHK